MLIQYLLDGIRDLIVSIIAGIPGAPPDFSTVMGEVSGAAGFLASTVAKFGVIMPWETFSIIIQVWLGLVGFWLVTLGIRFVLWILGR